MAITSVFPTQGFQNFIDESINVLSAINGTPGIGQFRSSVNGRAPITDIANNLKPSFGIERVEVQGLILIPTEFGQNGEPVYSVPNDDRGLIRYVGFGWKSLPNGNGVQTYTTGNITDYVEVTFYGTGLNLLAIAANSGNDVRMSVDGGTEVVISTGTYNNVQVGRNYYPNNVFSVVSGLALGIHTVKIRNNNASIPSCDVGGFEVVGGNTLTTNPGSMFSSGRRSALTAQDTQSATSGFTNVYGTAGAKGGHVLQYLASDGTVKKDIQYVDTTQLNMTSADHTNEEVARVYYPREFGCGRQDDFSTLAGTGSNRSFTLDDGTTTLVCQNYVMGITSGPNEGLGLASGAGDFITLTFVGTGLDIVNVRGSTGATTYTVTVDGIAVATASNIMGTGFNNLIKIVSGLPYGTHTVKIVCAAVSGAGLYVGKFITYQPKKPALPTGAIELADYNVMATYVADTTATTDTESTGVLFKQTQREFVFTGTWSALTLSALSNGPPGAWFTSATSAAAVQYTFFGTGVEIIAVGTSTVKIDGSNYTGSATALGAGSWTPGTSTWTGGTANGNKLSITGLTLGLHTVTLTWVSGTVFFHGMSVITPIYSAKPSLGYDAQNTLLIGSNALSDNRKTTAIKDAFLQKKNVSQAFGITSSPTTTSSTAVPLPDMSVTHVNTSGRIKVSFVTAVGTTATGSSIGTSIYVDGVAQGSGMNLFPAVSGPYYILSNFVYLNVSPGVHKIDIYWNTGSGTLTANTTQRTLLVEEA